MRRLHQNLSQRPGRVHLDPSTYVCALCPCLKLAPRAPQHEMGLEDLLVAAGDTSSWAEDTAGMAGTHVDKVLDASDTRTVVGAALRGSLVDHVAVEVVDAGHKEVHS